MEIKDTDMPCNAMGERMSNGWTCSERGNGKGWREELKKLEGGSRTGTEYSAKYQIDDMAKDYWRPDDE